MEEKLNEKVGPSIERIKKVAEELKRTSAKELEKEDLGKENTIGGSVIQREETKTARDDLLDLTQEKLKLEKILQEINNLKGRICQRIEFIKMLERREREIEKQLTSLREKNPNFLEEVKKKLDNLREHIK